MTDERAWEDLKRSAFEYRERAYAPYSGFFVGAAFRMSDGSVIGGCNIENASYGAAICAERAALAAALAAGRRDFVALAIATAARDPSPPCGICRQVLIEFAPDLTIRSYNEAGRFATYELADLLPESFGPDQLG